MKIFPPQPDIDLYADGFDKHDVLGRKAIGKYLSELVERVEDPLVISVDGQWGSGKSFFLKCWVGAHRVENEGTATTVYFDAFENDFLDDPLISLTGAVSGRLALAPKPAKAWEKARSAAARLLRPSARVALAVASAGASEIVGSVADAGISAAKQEAEKQVDALWRREEGQKAAMGEFREALRALTSPVSDEHPKKLVIAVDELDRCRPDYALNLLEVVKHFFNVPNVNFVLGVNMDELANSVRARYGQVTSAHLYLQKFISLTLNLPIKFGQHHDARHIALTHFENMAQKMGLNANLKEKIAKYLERMCTGNVLSLRSTEKVLTQAALVPQSDNSFDKVFQGYQWLLCGIVVLKSLFPSAYRDLLSGTLSIDELRRLFDIKLPTNSDSDHSGFIINHAWATFLEPTQDASEANWGNFFGRGVGDPERQLTNLITTYFDVIK